MVGECKAYDWLLAIDHHSVSTRMLTGQPMDCHGKFMKFEQQGGEMEGKDVNWIGDEEMDSEGESAPTLAKTSKMGASKRTEA